MIGTQSDGLSGGGAWLPFLASVSKVSGWGWYHWYTLPYRDSLSATEKSQARHFLLTGYLVLLSLKPSDSAVLHL